MQLSAIKGKAIWQWTTQAPQTVERGLAALIVPHFKLTFSGDAHGNVIAFLQLQRLNHCRGKADGKAVSPL